MRRYELTPGLVAAVKCSAAYELETLEREFRTGDQSAERNE